MCYMESCNKEILLKTLESPKLSCTGENSTIWSIDADKFLILSVTSSNRCNTLYIEPVIADSCNVFTSSAISPGK